MFNLQKAALQLQVTYTVSNEVLTLVCNTCKVKQTFQLENHGSSDAGSLIAFPLVHLQSCSTKLIGEVPVEELFHN